eukprot:g15061.t1
MDPQAKIMLLCFSLLGLALVLGVLRVMGAWYEHHVSRHDLIVESKQRRYDYLKAVADREREVLAMEEEAAMESIIIEEDEPELAQAA